MVPHMTLNYKLVTACNHISLNLKKHLPFTGFREITWVDHVFKFLLHFFLSSTVVHHISRRSKSIWLACSCQYVMLRLLWRGIISSLSEVHTCPPLHKNLNTSPSWTDLTYSHGLCDMRFITTTLQRGNWRTRKLSDVPKTCQTVEEQEVNSMKLISASKLPAHPFSPSFMFLENTTELIHQRVS